MGSLLKPTEAFHKANWALFEVNDAFSKDKEPSLKPKEALYKANGGPITKQRCHL